MNFSCIALKRYEEAAKLLFKRSDLTFTSLALDLVKNCDNEELFKAIKEQCDELDKIAKEKEDEKQQENKKELPTRAELFLSNIEHVNDGDTSKNDVELI